MRRLLLGCLLVLALLATASCSGDDPSTTRTPDASTSAAVPTVASGSVDVCGLVPDRLRQRVDRDDHFTTKLAFGSEGYVVCGMPGTVTFEYGYLVAGDPDLPRSDSEYVSEVDGLGDRAVLDRSSLQATLWVKSDGVLIRVRNDSVGSAGDAAISLATQREVAEAMVRSTTRETVARTEPIDLGPGCPPADSDVVTDVVGRTVTARGGVRGDDVEPECQYFGDTATRIDLNRTVQDGATEEFFDAANDRVVEWPGVQKAWTDRDAIGGTLSLQWSTAPDNVWFLDATRLSGDESGRPDPTLAQGKALAAAFMRLNPLG